MQKRMGLSWLTAGIFGFSIVFLPPSLPWSGLLNQTIPTITPTGTVTDIAVPTTPPQSEDTPTPVSTQSPEHQGNGVRQNTKTVTPNPSPSTTLEVTATDLLTTPIKPQTPTLADTPTQPQPEQDTVTPAAEATSETNAPTPTFLTMKPADTQRAGLPANLISPWLLTFTGFAFTVCAGFFGWKWFRKPR